MAFFVQVIADGDAQSHRGAGGIARFRQPLPGRERGRLDRPGGTVPRLDHPALFAAGAR